MNEINSHLDYSQIYHNLAAFPKLELPLPNCNLGAIIQPGVFFLLNFSLERLSYDII